MKTYRQKIRKEVEKITGIPARRIQFYSDNGLVSLDKRDPGRGKERLYSKKNMLELLIIKELSKHRVELSRIKEIIFDLPKKIDLQSIYRMFDPKTHDTDNPWGYFIVIFGSGEVQYNLQVDPSTLKVSNVVEIDMKNQSSYFLVSISRLAAQLFKV